VLARGEGALGAMTPPFLVGPGAPIGSGSLDPNRPRPGPNATAWEKLNAAVRDFVRPARGQQWMSWVHVDDIVGILLMALDNSEARGPINGTAPNPVRNADFSRTLSKVLWRPHAPQRFFLPVGPPDAAIKLALGDVAEIITTGQKVLPERAQTLGYDFRYPDLDAALRAIFAASKPAVQDAKKPAGALTD
jgi:NAD dependent epimerase/dehydratase family enzyme